MSPYSEARSISVPFCYDSDIGLPEYVIQKINIIVISEFWSSTPKPMTENPHLTAISFPVGPV